jgi:hypothetical protein
MGGDPSERAGLFRAGRSTPDATCQVGVGAELTVAESPSPHFTKYKPMPLEIAHRMGDNSFTEAEAA